MVFTFSKRDGVVILNFLNAVISLFYRMAVKGAIPHCPLVSGTSLATEAVLSRFTDTLL